MWPSCILAALPAVPLCLWTADADGLPVRMAFTLGWVVIGCCLWGWRRSLAGTTLLGAWWWGWTVWLGFGLLALARWRCLAVGASIDWYGPARFAAVTATLGPPVMVLGAKRPQHHAWTFVVLSLWVILVLPAAEVLWLHRGEPMQVRDARIGFVAALIVVSLANYLPTRYGPSALLYAGGQALLLWPHAGWGDPGPAATRATSLAAAALLAGALAWAWRRAVPRRRSTPLLSLWEDFRDHMGMLWAIRVAERLNVEAARASCAWRWNWTGPVTPDGRLLPADDRDRFDAEMRRMLRPLLRRFVSPAWIGERLEGPLN